MLRIIQQANAAAAKKYYSQADYYAAGLESASLWGGKGAAQLGLTGQVTKSDFEMLCDNLDPRTGRSLTARTRDDRTVLYDFNLNVPKSLSIMCERTGDPKLIEAIRSAADTMMSEVEDEMKARVRKGGQDTDRITGNAVYASFLHHTSRPSKTDGKPDPNTHLHICVFNATYDRTEGQWKAGQFRGLKRDAPYWQAVFHSHLTKKLAELGWGIEHTKDGWELQGVPKETIRKFSRRTEEIEALAKELGIIDPVAKSKLGATTREAKTEENVADLREYWDSRLTPAERQALDRLYAGDNDGIIPLQPTVESAVDYAVKHAFERASVVPEKRLVAAALQQGVGGVTAEEVRAEFNRRGLITREWDGQLVATTREVLAEENRVLDFARSGRDACRPLAPKHTIQREWLDASQKNAVQHILNSRDRVMIVRGVAGAGKSTSIRETVEALAANHVPIAMLAPSANASRIVLREEEKHEGADTVARFLVDQKYREQARNGVIFCDEAGLVGVPTMAKLFDAAKDLNARVVLLGDAMQNSPVERGSSLRVLQSLAGLPVAEINEIKRQSGAYKAAVEALSEGRIEEGLARLDGLKAIHEVEDEGERLRQLAEKYLEITAKGEKESVLVVAPTHYELNRVTEVLRHSLKAEGRLGEEREIPQLVPLHRTEAERGEVRHYSEGEVLQFIKHAPGHAAGSRLTVGEDANALPLDHPDRFQVYRSSKLSVAVGDKIRLTAGGWTRGEKRHRLNNGTTYTLAGFTQRGDLKLSNGWIVDRDFAHWSHGYVNTAYAAQGSTVNHVLVAQSAVSLPATNENQFYVAVSRGRHSVTIFTDSREELGNAVRQRSPRLTASELIEPNPPVSNGLSLRRVAMDRQKRSLWERARAGLTETSTDRDKHQGYGAGGSQ